MIWMNRRFRKFLIAGVIVIAFIFVLPYIWDVNAEWYFSNLNWLVPLAIVVFIAPIVPFILNNWDIHFDFQPTGDTLTVILSNYGTNPFNFNRIQFASGKKKIIGERKFYPKKGIYDVHVEFHGGDTPSQILHDHIGCTLRKGLPITLQIRNHQAPESLRNFEGNEKIYLCLYYEGSDQRVYSQRIQPEIVTELIQNYKPG